MPTDTPDEGLFITELPNANDGDNSFLAVIETSNGSKKIDLLPFLRKYENDLYSGYKYSINTVADMTLKGYALENGGTIPRINYSDFCERFIYHHNSRYSYDSNNIIMKDLTDHWAYNSNNDDPFSKILSSVPEHYHNHDDNGYTVDYGMLGWMYPKIAFDGNMLKYIETGECDRNLGLRNGYSNNTRDTHEAQGGVGTEPIKTGIETWDRPRVLRGRTAGENGGNPIFGRDIDVYPNSYNQNAYSYIGEYIGTTNKETYSMFDPITLCYKGKVTLLGDNGFNKFRMTSKMPKDSDIKDIISFYGSTRKRDRFLMFIGDRFEIVGLQEFMFQVNKYREEQLALNFPKIDSKPLDLDGYGGYIYDRYFKESKSYLASLKSQELELKNSNKIS